jgi:hypothetical protein
MPKVAARVLHRRLPCPGWKIQIRRYEENADLKDVVRRVPALMPSQGSRQFKEFRVIQIGH